jgi:hypothetical protein
LKDALTWKVVDKEDFSELFKSCYIVAVRTNRHEKPNAAAALLANLLLRPGDPATTKRAAIGGLLVITSCRNRSISAEPIRVIIAI